MFGAITLFEIGVTHSPAGAAQHAADPAAVDVPPTSETGGAGEPDVHGACDRDPGSETAV